MSTMVERVARAIFEKWAESEKSETTWAELLRMQSLDGYQQAKGVYRLAMIEARAAIEAMREPTDAMDEAGQNIANKAYLDPEELPADARFVWQAMIDAALNEQEQGR